MRVECRGLDRNCHGRDTRLLTFSANLIGYYLPMCGFSPKRLLSIIIMCDIFNPFSTPMLHPKLVPCGLHNTNRVLFDNNPKGTQINHIA